jgi:hypothetical protein
MFRYYVVLGVVMTFMSRSFCQHVFKDIKHNGAAPSLATDNNNVYLVFASGDTILFCSSNNKGKVFIDPIQVSILTQMSTGGGRGPQIVAAKNELVIAAADKSGNIYTYTKNKSASQWKKAGRINDVAEVAKEAFVSLASNDKGEVYAVWLDLRNNHKNKIAGAKSFDGGKTWSKNKIIYNSPDGTVCECCKPSVVMKDRMVVVMFRNWLKGDRDLFITTSIDGGSSFDKVKQLGEENWKLNACPMDGGGLTINNENTINTVWRREGDIYTCEPGKKEIKITTGKQCTIAGNNNGNFISFIKDGKVYCIKPDGSIIELGIGSYPRLIMADEITAVCAWQQDKEIKYAMVNK